MVLGPGLLGEQAVLLVETGATPACTGGAGGRELPSGCPVLSPCGHRTRGKCKAQFPLHLSGMRCASPEGSQHCHFQHWGTAPGTQHRALE